MPPVEVVSPPVQARLADRVLLRLPKLASPSACHAAAKRLRIARRDADAFRLDLRAARAGLAAAQHEVGLCYAEGRGVPPNLTEAAAWLERAGGAEQGRSQALLATLFLKGMPFAATEEGSASSTLFQDGTQASEPDFEQALTWARRAAASGSAEGEAIAGYILSSGPEALRDPVEAERHYRVSAMAGCPQGQLGFGLILSARGEVQAAAGWVSRAATAGLATACYVLGVMLQRGQGVAQDAEQAVLLLRRAAEQGVRPAQARLGLALLDGAGAVEDPLEAETWLRRAALAGDAEAAALVGDLYARGENLPPNYLEAARWFRLAADKGHAKAARALATLSLLGLGMPRDEEEGQRLLALAASQGDAVAQVDAARLALAGFELAAEPIQTESWFAVAAEAGDPVATYNLAVCHALGLGAPLDRDKARRLLRVAAERVVNAQFWYARLLIEDLGDAAALEEARGYLKRAAEEGLLEAAVAYAEMLANGRGGPRDIEQALRTFEAAAGAGHVGAMFAAGALLGGGHGVPEDRVRAQDWFRQAAENGHPPAQQMLGRYLLRGLAGAIDTDAGEMWLRRAAGATTPQSVTTNKQTLPSGNFL